ncbi:NADH dehydrogenase [ubiquinone] 1 beta subcomplex subunit 1 [Eleutherodactylus coqui]|uniref:NADH dehydrogenase [ubiquinone] 1 beta subcomplex subunit 1 n=1 Tax=Eleutherodactylus coqui TaxID=57060 RepID=UPI0034634155
MVNVMAQIREAWTYALLPASFLLGYWLDKWNDSRMDLYKNKSILYQRELKPSEDAGK